MHSQECWISRIAGVDDIRVPRFVTQTLIPKLSTLNYNKCLILFSSGLLGGGKRAKADVDESDFQPLLFVPVPQASDIPLVQERNYKTID